MVATKRIISLLILLTITFRSEFRDDRIEKSSLSVRQRTEKPAARSYSARENVQFGKNPWSNASNPRLSRGGVIINHSGIRNRLPGARA